MSREASGDSHRKAMDDTNTHQAAPQNSDHDLVNKRKRTKSSDMSQSARKRFQEALKKSIIDMPLEEPSEEEMIEAARSSLQEHSERRTALFFSELTPSSSARGAGCRLFNCGEKIYEDDY